MKKILETLKLKWAEYLLEVIVITLGILGAFTLNNWNENRQTNNDERKVLLALKNEFTKNQALIGEAVSSHKTIEDQAKELLEIIGPESILTDLEKFNSLLGAMTYPPRYNPSNAVLNTVISSGDLSLIQNDVLKYSISSLTGLLADYEHWIKVDYNNLHDHTGPFIIKNYSFKNFPYAATLGQSKFDFDPLKLIRSSELESSITLRWLNAKNLNRIATNIQEQQAKLIEPIEEELH